MLNLKRTQVNNHWALIQGNIMRAFECDYLFPGVQRVHTVC